MARLEKRLERIEKLLDKLEKELKKQIDADYVQDAVDALDDIVDVHCREINDHIQDVRRKLEMAITSLIDAGFNRDNPIIAELAELEKYAEAVENANDLIRSNAEAIRGRMRSAMRLY